MNHECETDRERGLVVQYWVDAQCKIVRVNWDWEEFAQSNDTHTLSASQVLGRELGEFICDDTTRMLVYALVASARDLQRPVQRPYRCDSPDCKRFMEMKIVPEPNGLVRLDHKIVKTEPMAARARFQLAPGNTSTVIPHRCSMCNRLRFEDEWLEVDLALAYGLIADHQTTRVVYTICPMCKVTLNRSRKTPLNPPKPD